MYNIPTGCYFAKNQFPVLASVPLVRGGTPIRWEIKSSDIK